MLRRGCVCLPGLLPSSTAQAQTVVGSAEAPEQGGRRSHQTWKRRAFTAEAWHRAGGHANLLLACVAWSMDSLPSPAVKSSTPALPPRLTRRPAWPACAPVHGHPPEANSIAAWLLTCQAAGLPLLFPQLLPTYALSLSAALCTPRCLRLDSDPFSTLTPTTPRSLQLTPSQPTAQRSSVS